MYIYTVPCILFFVFFMYFFHACHTECGMLNKRAYLVCTCVLVLMSQGRAGKGRAVATNYEGFRSSLGSCSRVLAWTAAAGL